jgi:hypothetical protein
MAQLVETDAGLRLSVEDILAEHRACVKWAQMGKALSKTIPAHRRRRDFRLDAIMAPHRDVIDAATRCVAGRGHH